LRSLEATTMMNGDGFGLGWYGTPREPGIFREVRPAWSDDNLQNLSRHIRSHLFFAHVRAATATPVMRPNCHPFSYDRWMFMHNGYIGDWHRLRRRVEALIPDEYYASRAGTTDSEAIFLAMMAAGVEDDPIGAAATVLGKLKAMMSGNEPSRMLRFTAALSDGQNIYAFRYAVKDSANTLYYRSNSDGTVLASEPLDDDRARWTAVAENSVVIAKASEPISIRPFNP
jgi:glutamine amidotransferase